MIGAAPKQELIRTAALYFRLFVIDRFARKRRVPLYVSVFPSRDPFRDKIKIIGGNDGELDAAAVQAARTARFSPAKSGRDNVASTVRLTLTFRLRN